MDTTASRFTLRKNAERAARAMIRKGTAPAVDYGIKSSDDGFEIVWKIAKTAPTTDEVEDQQDHLTASEQRCKRSRHHRLRIAPGYHDDDIGAVDRGSEIARRALDCSEPTILAFDIHTAARSNFGELRIINIVEPQLEPGDAQFGDEIKTTNSCPNDRNGLRGSVCHGFPPVC